MERVLKSTLKNGAFNNVSPERSRIMSAIRGKSNKTTERALRMALVRCGLRGWVLHPPAIEGKPDFYFPKAALAVFVDGCFWHGCPKCGHTPNTNRLFWATKIERNKERDRTNSRKLKNQGVSVIRLWEHELKEALPKCVLSIERVAGFRKLGLSSISDT
jgi:DNA mismatch endonuclease (patch repair protein)